jgi:hypothetical protein
MRFSQYKHGNSIIVGVKLYKTDNLEQTIWHLEGCQKILIFKPCHERSQTVIFKNLSGYMELEDNGDVVLWELEKEKHKCSNNVKEIKAKDFEHYAEDFKPNAKDDLFIFHN